MEDAIFEKFNEMIDVDGLKQDVENSSSGEFAEVPKGDYEVKIVKLELGKTGEQSKTPNMPKASVWFEVLTGDYKGQKIFMNQMLTTGFGVHKMNEFLNSLETGISVQFDDYVQYAHLLEQIFQAVDGRAEYQLAYGVNNKGYTTYTIVERFKD